MTVKEMLEIDEDNYLLDEMESYVH